jgi:hypothetical protein
VKSQQSRFSTTTLRRILLELYRVRRHSSTLTDWPGSNVHLLQMGEGNSAVDRRHSHSPKLASNRCIYALSKKRFHLHHRFVTRAVRSRSLHVLETKGGQPLIGLLWANFTRERSPALSLPSTLAPHTHLKHGHLLDLSHGKLANRGSMRFGDFRQRP